MGKRSPIIHALLVRGVMGLHVAVPLFQVKGVNSTFVVMDLLETGRSHDFPSSVDVRSKAFENLEASLCLHAL
jgi:hypothetical protein